MGASNNSNSVGLFVKCSLPFHEESFLLLMTQLAVQIHLSHEQSSSVDVFCLEGVSNLTGFLGIMNQPIKGIFTNLHQSPVAQGVFDPDRRYSQTRRGKIPLEGVKKTTITGWWF